MNEMSEHYEEKLEALYVNANLLKLFQSWLHAKIFWKSALLRNQITHH